MPEQFIKLNHMRVVFWISVMLMMISCSPRKEHGEHINILFIMADQYRGDCIGRAGADWIETPNLDALADEGVLFSNAYSSVPSCLPARTAILTGKSPWSHGLLGYYTEAERYRYELPRMLREAGYRTHAVGKNHFNPIRNTHGYETVVLEEGWHSVIDSDGKCDYQLWFEKIAPGKDMNASGLHYTDHRGGRTFTFADSLHPTYWTAQRAVDFLETYDEERPWLLKVSFQRPHPPFDPPQRWYDHYSDVNYPMPLVGDWAEEKYGSLDGSLEIQTNATLGKFPEEEIQKSRQSYYAAISFVDEQMGRVIQALKERGDFENTLIIFTADHGDMMGDHHMWRKCKPYQGSVNIPMILRWPGNMPIQAERGQIRNELVELRDLLPTFLDAASLQKPEELDGESMLDVLRNKAWRKQLDLEHARIYEPDNAWTCLTDGSYKYVYFTLTGEQQLFDFANDPYELVDLAKDPENKKLVSEWRVRMIEHLSIRGERWVKDGELTIQEESQKYSPNDPRYESENTTL
jgi:choline-sulfatase